MEKGRRQPHRQGKVGGSSAALVQCFALVGGEWRGSVGQPLGSDYLCHAKASVRSKGTEL